ncbi:MAG: DUF262 domain-containing protein [Muribaculaceae bacterium]|nr:DUF262 domain-containing protein [Muribaculaceae bacterium]
MKSDNINNFTPKTLAEDHPDVVFNIPIYQRLFAWEKKQIYKLLEDLTECWKNKESNYYIGILTVSKNTNQQLDLIDGQQRMTVVSLIAIALKELYEDELKYWDKFLNFGKRIEFSAREKDTQYFYQRSCGINETLYPNKMMEQSINDIKIWLQTQFLKEDNILDYNDIKDFSDFIWNNLIFFCSYLPESYLNNPRGLNKYFEAMNATGKQLQQHEILLVDLINGHPQSESLSILWNKIGDEYKRILSRGEEESIDNYRLRYEDIMQNYQTLLKNNDKLATEFSSIEEIEPKSNKFYESNLGDVFQKMIISFEELLLMALDLTIGSEYSSSFYKTDHLLTRFRDANLKEKNLIDEFFENLIKCRLILDYKIIWQETEGDYDYNLITLDINHKIEKFQSMLHVSNQNQFYRWLKPYIKWIIDNPSPKPEQEFKALFDIDRSLHPNLPKKAELTYQSVESGKVERYWFWRLDFELWDHVDKEWLKDYPQYKEAVKRYVFRSNRSIEHLHPQTPTDSKSDKWEGYELNRFGNLAMISSSFNSQQSNDPAGMKMERIHHQIETSQLQSLKMLDMWTKYKESNENDTSDTWTKDKVIQHENEMYQFLENLYQN